MKKILMISFMSLMLAVPFATRLSAIIDLPVFTGTLTSIEYRVVAEDADVIIVIIDGQEYVVKKQK